MTKITNPSLKTFRHCERICQNPRGNPPSHRHCEKIRKDFRGNLSFCHTKPSICHTERSEVSQNNQNRDISLSLNMTKKIFVIAERGLCHAWQSIFLKYFAYA